MQLSMIQFIFGRVLQNIVLYFVCQINELRWFCACAVQYGRMVGHGNTQRLASDNQKAKMNIQLIVRNTIQFKGCVPSK